MHTPTCIADTTHHTGEGPLWHPEENRLFWVDIPPGRLYSYDPATKSHSLAYEFPDVPLGGFTIEQDGALLCFTHSAVLRYVPGSDTATQVASIDADTRFNDVIADPKGRVFCGTMPGETELGDLYRLDPDGQSQVVINDVDISNGMGFSPDLSRFYFTESNTNRIFVYDYTAETGHISNGRALVEIPPDGGIPDGMTVDSAGNIWSARWNGSKIVQYTEAGETLQQVSFPAKKVSAVTFGGSNYTELYVTTALNDNSRDREGSGAGGLFRIQDVSPSGTAEYRSDIA